MKMLQGRRIGDFAEAAILAFHDTGKDDMSLDIANLFTSALDRDRLRAEAERGINVSVHGKYGQRAAWSGRQRFVKISAGNPDF